MGEEIKEDIKIKCQDCGREFVFTVSDQDFYEANNYVPPKRCKSCRNARILRRNKINY